MQKDKVILFMHEGKTAVVYPVVSCGLTIEEIAKKDVPHGVAYKIVDATVDPEMVDMSETDGVGSDYGNGSDWYVGSIDDGKVALIVNHKTKEIKDLREQQ